MQHVRFSDQWAIVGTIDPIDGNAADPNTDIIDMSIWHKLAFIMMTGVIAASSTIDFALYEDEAANMAGESAISGKSITQYGATDDGKHVIVNLDASELTAGNRYVRGKMDNSAHSQLVTVLVLGLPRYGPASDNDHADVKEIVA